MTDRRAAPDGHFRQVYPFSAIVGQETMKKALLLNVIDAGIGGVLIRGERGTAKSTAVRSLSALLPRQLTVDSCRFGCDPDSPATMCDECLAREERGCRLREMRVVELPVSATEDRVVGTIDLMSAIKTGSKRFEPGILAEANRSILYVDEVNLLNDHVVDVLLDVAAMGVNIVEREGVSYSHPSSFILVGTMNPEEGDLRPQLLDRFGLCVDIGSSDDADQRISVLKRRREFDEDPAGFREKWRSEDVEISSRVAAAKELLEEVVIPDDVLDLIVRTCIEAGVEGHRADIIMMRTSAAISAYDGRTAVNSDDVKEAAELVLLHRRRDPPKQPPEEPDKEDRPEDQQQEQNKEQQSPPPPPPSDDWKEQKDQERQEPTGTAQFAAGEIYKVRSEVMTPQLKMDRVVRESRGRRSDTEAPTGRYVGSRIPTGRPATIAMDATVRTAAANQAGRMGKMAINIEPPDVREKVLERRTGNLLIFTVDASGSMGARQRMVAVKGAILSLLVDAYQKRDRVGLVVFRGDSAEVVVPPTNSVALAQERMSAVPTGGRTPLGHGLSIAYELVARERRTNPGLKPLIVLISDGRANVSGRGDKPMEELVAIAQRIREEKVPALVIDSEEGLVALGFAKKLAENMDAKYVKLEELRSDTVLDAARKSLS